mmetsp:Transcript_60538/g.72789  ORF Transcript_60538/g.72789 Transcript_60538/m.72789 type:complete len:867 (-) Transcript_60538:427-3027(-)
MSLSGSEHLFNCTNASRLDAFYKFLSLSSDTYVGYERVALDSSEELLANISFIPAKMHLQVESVGEWFGPTDIAEYIMISWKEFNDGFLKMRQVVGSRCLSPSIVEYETSDKFILSNGGEVTSTLKGVVEYEQDTHLITKIIAGAPKELIASYFEPRKLCDVAVLRCLGDLYPYESVQDCYDFMSTLPQACTPNTKEGQTSFDGGINGYFQGDTVACRYLHLASAALRPTYHCKHLSNDSAGKCPLNKCPSAVKHEEIRNLDLVFDAGIPEALLWFEIAIAVIVSTLFILSHFWYRKQRMMLGVKTKKGSKRKRVSIDGIFHSQFPELVMENVCLSWTKKMGGKNILELGALHLGDKSFQITALKAPSGTGKSSFMKLIAGFELHHMELTVGKFVKKPKIILCEQSSDMWPKEMIVRDIFLFISQLFRSDMRRVRHVIETLEIDEFLEQRFGTLSGGQQQLVHISSALFSSYPSMIFLDEPFCSLDEKKAIKLMQVLRNISNFCGHSFVMTLHMCSDTITNEFDSIVKLDEQLVLKDTEKEMAKSRGMQESAEGDGDINIKDEARTSLYINKTNSFISEVKAIVILWHAQFSGMPLVELSVAQAGIVGGLLIGYMGHGGMVDHPDVDYIPTEESIQSIYYMIACLLGASFIVSFGVSHIYWTREATIITNFNSQGIVRGSAYILTNLFRSMVSSITIAIGFVGIVIYVLECTGSNTTLLIANCSVFLIMWTNLSSFVCGVAPVAYSAHALLYLNSLGMVFSGVLFNWEYLYQGFKTIHYANPLFLFSSACSFLFLEDVDTGCEDHDGLLHYGQCATGERAFEMRGMPMVNSLVAHGVALLFTVLSSLGMAFFILKGPKSCELKMSK